MYITESCIIQVADLGSDSLVLYLEDLFSIASRSEHYSDAKCLAFGQDSACTEHCEKIKQRHRSCPKATIRARIRTQTVEGSKCKRNSNVKVL